MNRVTHGVSVCVPAPPVFLNRNVAHTSDLSVPFVCFHLPLK